MIVYLFANLELALIAEQKISENMGFVLPERHDVPSLIDNANHVDFGKAIISEVEGDEYHHNLWLQGVTGYEEVEYDQDWFVPTEI